MNLDILQYIFSENDDSKLMLKDFPSLFVQKNEMFFKTYNNTASNMFKTSSNCLDGLQI